MFEELHLCPWALARHLNAPFADERARYLSYCAERGDSQATLASKATRLIYVARQLSKCPELDVAIERLKAVDCGGQGREVAWIQKLNTRWSPKKFIGVARPWLRFLGWWREPIALEPFQEELDQYCHWMKDLRGMTEMTVDTERRYVTQFFRWYAAKRRSLSEAQPVDIDRYLAEGGATRWRRISVRDVATSLRAFFRYGAIRGWSPLHLADSIQAPRVYTGEALPAGPGWTDVKRMLAATNTKRAKDLRDRPILMLFAIYGLRVTEVARLRLEDVDWEHRLLHVTRVKRRGRQTYPLLPSISEALIRYLKTVRRHCAHREVFLGLRSPFLPLAHGGLYSLVSRRLTALGVRTAHHGPHSLRHACAARLVAEGLSLKVIGDHLGHRSASATRIYAKVDLSALREVGTFDLGELL
jgi:site-specific recombinase XerD